MYLALSLYICIYEAMQDSYKEQQCPCGYLVVYPGLRGGCQEEPGLGLIRRSDPTLGPISYDVEIQIWYWYIKVHLHILGP